MEISQVTHFDVQISVPEIRMITDGDEMLSDLHILRSRRDEIVERFHSPSESIFSRSIRWYQLYNVDRLARVVDEPPLKNVARLIWFLF